MMIYSNLLLHTTVVILIILDFTIVCIHLQHDNEISKNINWIEETPPVIIPAPTKQTSALIFLHGLNLDDDETRKNWSEILTNVQLPHMKVVCASPYFIRCKKRKKGILWYHTRAFVNGVVGFVGATEYIQELIKTEIRNGIPAERVILGGNSQGSIVAFHSAITFPERLAGFVAVSTNLPGAIQRDFTENTYIPANKNIPIFQCHHHVVTENFPKQTTTVFKKISHDVELKVYNKSELLLPDEAAQDMKHFCNKVIGPV